MKRAIRRPVLTQDVLAQLRLPLADLMRTTPPADLRTTLRSRIEAAVIGRPKPRS